MVYSNPARAEAAYPPSGNMGQGLGPLPQYQAFWKARNMEEEPYSDDTGKHDHMADTILTESEASLAVEDLGWRYLLDCLTTAVTVDSLFDACEVIRAAVDIAGPYANDHLRLRATADRVEFTLETRGKFRVTTQDVDLARSITKAVRTAGYQTVAHPAHHSVQSLAIAIDAMDIPAVRPFWKAVLGYDHVPAPADLVDPSDGGPSLWFQQMDEPHAAQQNSS